MVVRPLDSIFFLGTTQLHFLIYRCVPTFLRLEYCFVFGGEGRSDSLKLLDNADFVKSERSKRKKRNAKEREDSRLERGSVSLCES